MRQVISVRLINRADVTCKPSVLNSSSQACLSLPLSNSNAQQRQEHRIDRVTGASFGKRPPQQMLSTLCGTRGQVQVSYLLPHCPPGLHPGHLGHLYQGNPFFPPFLKILVLLGGQVALGDQAGCRLVEGHPSGNPCGQRLQASGQPHTEGHRPGTPRRSWWSPGGDKKAVAGESGHGVDTWEYGIWDT